MSLRFPSVSGNEYKSRLLSRVYGIKEFKGLLHFNSDSIFDASSGSILLIIDLYEEILRLPATDMVEELKDKLLDLYCIACFIKILVDPLPDSEKDSQKKETHGK